MRVHADDVVFKAPLTDDEYARLWRLSQWGGITPEDAKALEKLLAHHAPGCPLIEEADRG